MTHRFASVPTLFITLGIALLVADCRGNSGLTSAPMLPPSPQQLAHTSKIQHVVIIVQENRTFNNLFYGYPGAKTATFGLDSKNKQIPLKPDTN